MKKKYYISVVLIVLLIGIFPFIYFNRDNNDNTLKEVVYNGDNLLISIDGVSSNTLPTSGTYYLTDYDCKSKNTKLSWDNTNYKLSVSNGNKKGGVVCNLTFKSNPKLSEMPVGSYVSYTGIGGKVGFDSVNCQNGGPATSTSLGDTAETEAPNSCLGQNARQDIDENGNTYGYCYSASYKYYTKGWRIAYIDSNNKPVIISAGSPECNSRESIAGNTTYIKKANTKAMKYCNSDYVDGDCSCIDSDGYCDCTDSDEDGLCDEIENGTVDAWAVNDIDFYNMTKEISEVGKRLTGGSSSLGDIGGTLGETLFCYQKYSCEECGYNNDLIDNGGYYWFAARHSSSDERGVYWNPGARYVNGTSSRAYGLRPVISLSSSVVVTGGKGTMEEPYTIGNINFKINNGAKYINSSNNSSVTLNLLASSDVTQMCISVDSSSCSDYVDFASTYTLDWSGDADGEKVVYVYYKNASGDIVASLSDSIIIDTVAPSNSSVTIGGSDGMYRTLTLSSKGADYMCFSNISSNSSDCTKWVSYNTSYDWKLQVGTGSKNVYAFFKDKAGNISGPYSASTTCTNDCDYEYWIDARNNSYIYLMRSDGATAMVTTTSTDVNWYRDGINEMEVCGADNYTDYDTYAYIWCIGKDNNIYYKQGYNNKTWKKHSVSSYVDTSRYDYSIYPNGDMYAYIVRSDGKINRSVDPINFSGSVSSIDSYGINNHSWSWGYDREMATCSGYSSSRVICLGKDGYYYYRTSYSSTTDYLGGSIFRISSRTNKNSWIDMYSSTYTNIIESDGTKIVNARFSYSTSSTTWTTSTISAGVKACASSGYSYYNYCLGNDYYLYYKSYDADTWSRSSFVVYE